LIQIYGHWFHVHGQISFKAAARNTGVSIKTYKRVALSFIRNSIDFRQKVIFSNRYTWNSVIHFHLLRQLIIYSQYKIYIVFCFLFFFVFHAAAELFVQTIIRSTCTLWLNKCVIVLWSQIELLFYTCLVNHYLYPLITIDTRREPFSCFLLLITTSNVIKRVLSKGNSVIELNFLELVQNNRCCNNGNVFNVSYR
jgi:hypothetical protein